MLVFVRLFVHHASSLCFGSQESGRQGTKPPCWWLSLLVVFSLPCHTHVFQVVESSRINVGVLGVTGCCGKVGGAVALNVQ